MAAEIDDNEPVPKLTAKLRSEIMPPEPFEYTVLKPAEIGLEPAKTAIEPEDEERFEETMESVTSLRKPKRQTSKPKGIRKSPTSDGASISKLHSDLKKHSDASKKTDSAILDIRKELKDLLLIHHATIKDLQKQLAQMHRKVVSIDSSRKSTKSKAIGKKIPSTKKPKKKSIKKKRRNGG